MGKDFEIRTKMGIVLRVSGNYDIVLNLDYRLFNYNHCLKVQSCKLYNNKYIIASTEITNTEIFAFIAVLVFKLLSRKFLFINRQ